MVEMTLTPKKRSLSPSIEGFPTAKKAKAQHGSASGEQSTSSIRPSGTAHGGDEAKLTLGNAPVELIDKHVRIMGKIFPSGIIPKPYDPDEVFQNIYLGESEFVFGHEGDCSLSQNTSRKELTLKNGTTATSLESKIINEGREGDIKSLFHPIQLDTRAPRFNDDWGRVPYPGPDGPQPRRGSPPARTSNAVTNPPLFEDRKAKFELGRYQVVDGVTIDQRDMLVISLIDMRPKSAYDRNPRRMPNKYQCGYGVPRDWSCSRTIKALNDRRFTAIERVTLDQRWSDIEREYLTTLFVEFPDASITEITERFNWRFKNDFIEVSTAFNFHDLHPGRTIESVRAEYLAYKKEYDNGKVPSSRAKPKKSIRAKELEELEDILLEKNFGERLTPKSPRQTRRNKREIENDRRIAEMLKVQAATKTTPTSEREFKAATPKRKNWNETTKRPTPVTTGIDATVTGALAVVLPPSPLTPLDEELYSLAVGNSPDDIQHSPLRSMASSDSVKSVEFLEPGETWVMHPGNRHPEAYARHRSI
ncbi:hypothetical protein CC78DRAFT_620148 [Lojkania enalia]|uniref:Myb-like domain-containing protein n=1 Tax=Lojkania enalia TaxID=147567 RepID=A0A9P4K1S6_9PLEO|nr:hypothetical protein CC78DRAFT_620148 [Didymosphaeria enalia]